MAAGTAEVVEDVAEIGAGVVSVVVAVATGDVVETGVLAGMAVASVVEIGVRAGKVIGPPEIGRLGIARVEIVPVVIVRVVASIGARGRAVSGAEIAVRVAKAAAVVDIVAHAAKVAAMPVADVLRWTTTIAAIANRSVFFS